MEDTAAAPASLQPLYFLPLCLLHPIIFTMSVSDSLQLAREYSLIGQYATALLYYDAVLADSSCGMDERGQALSERKLVKELQHQLTIFQQPPGAFNPTAAEDSSDTSRPTSAAAPHKPGEVPAWVYNRKSASKYVDLVDLGLARDIGTSCPQLHLASPRLSHTPQSSSCCTAITSATL